MLWNMRAVLAGLLLLAGFGCGGGGGERFGVYHLESAIGRPGSTGELRCGPPRQVCPGVVQQPPPHAFRYAVLADPALTADDIVRSTVRRGTDSSTGEALVIVDLTAEGTEAFANVTKEAARFGGRDLGWHHVAVVVGDEIVAFPQIDYDSYPDGLPGAPSIHIVAASDADARDLVRRLRGG
jgi:preprotein translocase subunit SecD